jgi:hypothetical protein
MRSPRKFVNKLKQKLRRNFCLKRKLRRKNCLKHKLRRKSNSGSQLQWVSWDSPVVRALIVLYIWNGSGNKSWNLELGKAG